MSDPAITNLDKYTVLFENDRVRVLEYRDVPGEKTTPHQHPDSIMYTLSQFQRRLIGGRERRAMSPWRRGNALARRPDA